MPELWLVQRSLCVFSPMASVATKYGWQYLIGTSYLYLTYLVDKSSAIRTRWAHSFGLIRFDLLFCFDDSIESTDRAPL